MPVLVKFVVDDKVTGLSWRVGEEVTEIVFVSMTCNGAKDGVDVSNFKHFWNNTR